MKEFIVDACSGIELKLKKEQTICIIDIEGKQVVDFFAEIDGNSNEYFSSGVTIDCNDSIKLNIGDFLYSNLYRPMLQIIYDDVGEHDLLHPCCRTEMYDFFYKNGVGHPNCLDNINKCLGENRTIIYPFNIFMHTVINENGKITVMEPLSQSGDKIVMRALENLRLGIAACSVSESKCNNHKCSPIKVIIDY